MKSYFFHNGLIQFIFAITVKVILFVPVLIYTVSRQLLLNLIGELFNWFHDLALKEDTWGNRFIKYPANDFLLKKDPKIPYGTNESTISRITSINYKYEKLTKLGVFMAHTMILLNDKSFEGKYKLSTKQTVEIVAIWVIIFICITYPIYKIIQ